MTQSGKSGQMMYNNAYVIGFAQYRGIPNFPEVSRSYDIIRQDWASSGGFETIKYGNQINSIPDLIHDESRKSKT